MHEQTKGHADLYPVYETDISRTTLHRAAPRFAVGRPSPRTGHKLDSGTSAQGLTMRMPKQGVWSVGLQRRVEMHGGQR